VKLVLFVEGKTEYMGVGGFLKRWLDARLPQRVRIAPVKFNGISDYCGDLKKKVNLDLSAARDVIAGIGLVDLCGLESALSFPPGIISIAQRYDWAKRELERSVDHQRFHQYFAVHETAAWLLPDPSIFPSEVKRDLTAVSNTPEEVNFNSPPAAVLKRAYRDRLGRRYQKAVDGPNLFRVLEPDRACAKCPYLKIMLHELLGFARSAMA
jgi:hypothetical protein